MRPSVIVLVATATATVVLAAQSSTPRGDWPSYGGTNWSQKYSPLDRITRDNFSRLTVAWKWTSPDFALAKQLGETLQPPFVSNGFKATPLVVNSVMYVTTGLGQIAAIDPLTGTTKWLHNPEVYKHGPPASVVGPWQTRGLAYWSDGRGDERLLMGTLDGYLIALEAKSGKPIVTFGTNGKSDLVPAIRGATRGPHPHLFSDEARYGPLFTPQSLYKEGGTRGTLQLPGINGGANWSGSGADPDTGFLYVPSRTGLTMMVLVEGKPSFTDMAYVPQGKVGPESYHPARPPIPVGPRALPLIKPPYSRMTAYNLNTGEIAWQVPTGPGYDSLRNHEALRGLTLPPLGGQGGQGGPLVTSVAPVLLS